MEHPFFTTAAATRAEALRWLAIAEKLLSARDLMGSKSFATRAREADSSLTPADEILAVLDTLIAGDRRIGNNQPDFYSILRLTPQQGADPDLVAGQYRSLVVLLNPQTNRFPFADQAFRLVIDAWSVLSNPSGKSLYDKELGFFHRQPDPYSVPIPAPQQNFIFPQAQQVVHGGESSGSIGATHFTQAPQVHAQPRAGPVFGGPTREPQNFMGFHSGSNIIFGAKPSPAPVNNQGQDNNYSDYGDYNVAASAPVSVTTHQQLNTNNYSNVGDNHNVSENVTIEAEGNVDRIISEENVDRIINEENVDRIINEENVDRIMEEEVVVEEVEEEEEEKDGSPVNNHGVPFWTACPYCYYMYEYPQVYIDCTMRCQNCKRAFQAVVIPSPPPVAEGQDAYFCCWGFMPMGFSMDMWEKNKGSTSKEGYTGRKPPGPRVYIEEDDDIFADISSSSESDVDWQDKENRKRKNTAQNGKGRMVSGITATRRSKKVLARKGKKGADGQNSVVSGGVSKVGRKRPNSFSKILNKLDLNVELSNEAEEIGLNFNKGNGPGRKEDDNMEGIGFFDGLDELFSNLPILKAA